MCQFLGGKQDVYKRQVLTLEQVNEGISTNADAMVLTFGAGE